VVLLLSNFNEANQSTLSQSADTKIFTAKKSEKNNASSSQFSSLIDNITTPTSYNKIICLDNGKPVDFVFVKVNSAFEKLTGLKKEDILGKRICEVLPHLVGDLSGWIDMYGSVALTGILLKLKNTPSI
jgi:PAS domain-containing protein